MICISLLGMLILVVVLNIIFRILEDSPNKQGNATMNAVHSVLVAGLVAWWLFGFVINCTRTYGPVISIT